MEIFINYLIVFGIGGAVCVLGQILINLTKWTSARILLIFLLLGTILEAVGVFSYIKDFAHSGVTIPILGFGSVLAKGAITGAKEGALLGAIVGALEAGSAGITSAIVVGFIVALLAKSHTKT